MKMNENAISAFAADINAFHNLRDDAKMRPELAARYLQPAPNMTLWLPPQSPTTKMQTMLRSLTNAWRNSPPVMTRDYPLR